MSGESPIVVVREPGRTPLNVVVVESLEVGRDATGILVNDPGVSRHHLVLRPSGARVIVTDLGSGNGTTIDGVTITGDTALSSGSVVRMGDTTIELASVTTPQPSHSPGEEASLTTISRLAADVASSPIAQPSTVQIDGTVTIVFTDIESSTELAYTYGDERWYSVLSKHTEIVRRELARHGGAEVKSQGDGFMLAFSSAHRAVLCMISVQVEVEALSQHNPEMAVAVRVGAHTGEAIVGDDGDLFGHHVNLASRIADQAAGGEILVSSLVREIVESRGDLHFGEPRNTTLKGLSGTYLLHPVLWRPDQPAE